MLQAKWAEIISGDEVTPWEIKNLCKLIAVFVETVSNLVKKLRTETCCGCLVDHPSQRRHDCLMITEREGWETHGKAIERAIEQNLVWKQFIEGVRVMKLTYQIGALEHYMSLAKYHEITLNLLMDLKESSDLTEYQSVVHYLSYWIEEH